MCFAENEIGIEADFDKKIHDKASIIQFNPYDTSLYPSSIVVCADSYDVTPEKRLECQNLGKNIISRSKFPILSVQDIATIVHITPTRAAVVLDYWTTQGCLIPLSGGLYTSADSI